MKKLYALFLTVLFAAAAAAAAPERLYDKTFQVQAGARFELDSHKGTIRVRTHAEPTIVVQARIYPEDGVAADVLDNVEIVESASARSVAIKVEHEPVTRSGDWLGMQSTMPMVAFDILVLDDADLVLVSHKSEFDVEAPAGSVEIESHKGTGKIAKVRNDFRLNTHKGEFEVDVETLGNLTVETHKGDVKVVIHGGRDFTVRGDTHKGKLSFAGRRIPVQKGERRGSSVDYREGSGAHKIELGTHKGNVALRFAD